MPGEFQVRPIGVIRTPYTDSAPYQPLAEPEGEFRLVLDPGWEEALRDLDRFRYIYVLYWIHRVNRPVTNLAYPPWAEGKAVGLFASRSPVRPNPIGLSVVKVLAVEGREVRVSSLDAFDGTPLLDIKPYVKDLDSKEDANYGWLEDLPGKDHLLLHIKGIPHDY